MSAMPPNTKDEKPPAASDGAPGATGEAALASAPRAVVGIGASAGGLAATKDFLAALPPATGLALILVQHLDPTHTSLLVELLATRTSMTVLQASEGMAIERDHLYIIPPGKYLSVESGLLHLSMPDAPHGARLPIDFLFRSLATAYRDQAIVVILSGSGTDGMPSSAMATNSVDIVLPVAEMPKALIEHVQRPPAQQSAERQPAARRRSTRQAPDRAAATGQTADCLPAIIDLLRNRTAHDFTLYKPGTLQRRIERRQIMAGMPLDDMGRYLALLHQDAAEIDNLANDLLINVSSFFRDPAVFDYLEKEVIPPLVRDQPLQNPLRIWVVGCSTGEEVYSLAMLFVEAISAAKRPVKLQFFASDVDADAISQARDGFYPDTIAADVPASRLARFFIKEERGYQIRPELRSAVVFTVQDVLADPPFSRLDFISCRNLLIYLRPEAQVKVIALFHFALRTSGILLLGSAEAAGNIDGRFEVISKVNRLYRHIGRAKPGELSVLTAMIDPARIPRRAGQEITPAQSAGFADLARNLLIEAYAPAAVLINRNLQILYSLGPTHRYLQVASGQPTHDIAAMAPDGMRIKLRSAIQMAIQENGRIVVTGCHLDVAGASPPFSIAASPVQKEGEQLLLLCFIDEANTAQATALPRPGEAGRIAELERELAVTRTELQSAIHNLEAASTEQKAINEETLSTNEEFQATNEELLTSKEELQSLNEELTALNSQLHETLERQRTSANDQQNILYSTDVATIFLDSSLNIRFFTPATRALFNVIPGDVGRPLADLRSLAVDNALLGDARQVLKSLVPVEHEIETGDGAWYLRRILPYRTQDQGVEGVVITFADISVQKKAADAVEAAGQQARRANAAKSRFLAAASHDLRQPLQTLTLLLGLLDKTVEGSGAKKLVARLDETLNAMSGMLNTLLDINQIEAGIIQPEITRFPINDLLNRMRDEFSYHAQEPRLSLRVVPCSLIVDSDPRLLEQMLRNLLSNAIKYTSRGKVLLGCRRQDGQVLIEVIDTGIGIAAADLDHIFEEYHQLDNTARERGRGLGLGLSIVRRLGDLLQHRISVRSQPDKGSAFTIAVPLAPPGIAAGDWQHVPDAKTATITAGHRTGRILVIEDDPDLRELLFLLLKDEGHQVTTAADGVAALALIDRAAFHPDIILADYNLPREMNGVQITTILRDKLKRNIPAVILTGDISTETLRDISLRSCVKLNKPVKLTDLKKVLQRLLVSVDMTSINAAAPTPLPAGKSLATVIPATVIYVVDDDRQVRLAIRSVLEDDGRLVEDFASCEAFLAAHGDQPHGSRGANHRGCLLIDAYLPGMKGLELLQRLQDKDQRMPAIMITGNSDVAMAVQAMKAGAADFIEKPVGRSDLLASIDRALEQSADASKLAAWRDTAAENVAALTARQRQILQMVLAGHPSKIIAADLGISQRTVENHRASIMKKTGSKSLPELTRVALAAELTTTPATEHRD